jgi:hypothetical protein
LYKRFGVTEWPPESPNQFTDSPVALGESPVSDEFLVLASRGLSEERPLWHLFLVADHGFCFSWFLFSVALLSSFPVGLCCLSHTEEQLTPASDVLFWNQVIQTDQFLFFALGPVTL